VEDLLFYYTVELWSKEWLDNVSWDTYKPSVVRLCVKLDFLKLRICYTLELKVDGRPIWLRKLYVFNTVREYQAFNSRWSKFLSFEYDHLNLHTTWEISFHNLEQAQQHERVWMRSWVPIWKKQKNRKVFLQLCCNKGVCIMIIFFQQLRVVNKDT